MSMPVSRFDPNCITIEGVASCGLLDDAQLARAREAGCRTVVNLCPLAEQKIDEQAVAGRLGLRYEHIPVAGAADLTRDNALRLAAILNEPGGTPVIVHCASGNRAGALLALKAFFADGSDPDQAIAIGRAAGLATLEPAVRAIMHNARSRA